MKSALVWQDGMAFDAELDGFHFALDADEQFGGRGLGPKPKGLLLTSLAGCTGMDVIAILGKMKVLPTAFRVSADGALTDEHPRRFDRITLRYEFEGEDLPAKKLRRAVQLSEERYCGVRASLWPGIEVTSEILLQGEVLEPTP